ncbi:PE family protein [Mycolicibacterium fallax]|uniref:PPE domain-containing protein n=1 Tax=Mycolicibacterium fallax TaxID=1793 RepID=A0A1X1RMP9_MYCFA|nr:PE family protein [Mycolicibacterium fallax]ORV09685.1 hypothetical protein AWC04_01330 [Mycolicibacterium fallax]
MEEISVDIEGLAAAGGRLLGAAGGSAGAPAACTPAGADSVSAAVAGSFSAWATGLEGLVVHAQAVLGAGGVSVAGSAAVIEGSDVAAGAGMQSLSAGLGDIPAMPAVMVPAAPVAPIVPPVPAVPAPMAGDQWSACIHGGPGSAPLRALAAQLRARGAELERTAGETGAEAAAIDAHWVDGEQRAGQNVGQVADWLRDTAHYTYKLATSADEAGEHVEQALARTPRPERFVELQQRVQEGMEHFIRTAGLDPGPLEVASANLAQAQQEAIEAQTAYAMVSNTTVAGAPVLPAPTTPIVVTGGVGVSPSIATAVSVATAAPPPTSAPADFLLGQGGGADSPFRVVPAVNSTTVPPLPSEPGGGGDASGLPLDRMDPEPGGAPAAPPGAPSSPGGGPAPAGGPDPGPLSPADQDPAGGPETDQDKPPTGEDPGSPDSPGGPEDTDPKERTPDGENKDPEEDSTDKDPPTHDPGDSTDKPSPQTREAPGAPEPASEAPRPEGTPGSPTAQNPMASALGGLPQALGGAMPSSGGAGGGGEPPLGALSGLSSLMGMGKSGRSPSADDFGFDPSDFGGAGTSPSGGGSDGGGPALPAPPASAAPAAGVGAIPSPAPPAPAVGGVVGQRSPMGMGGMYPPMGAMGGAGAGGGGERDQALHPDKRVVHRPVANTERVIGALEQERRRRPAGPAQDKETTRNERRGERR